MYRIAVGADHRGYELKKKLMNITIFDEQRVSWCDVGTYSDERTDYPLYTSKVIDKMTAGEVDYGIMICGSGIGATIAANRARGIYAANVWNEEIARLAKEDDNSNLLVLPADFIAVDQAQACIATWLTSKFKKGRYLERLKMLEKD